MPGAFAKPPFGSRLRESDPLSKNLAAYWAFNDGKGSLKIKDSVSVNDLTIGANFSFVSSVYGLALDRANIHSVDHLSLGTAIATGTTFSLAMRVLKRTTAVDYAGMFTQGSTGGLFWNAGGNLNKINYYYGADHPSATVLSLGVWHDVIISVLNGNLKYFIDGLPDANTYAGVTSLNLDSLITNPGGSEFDGQFLYAAIWLGRALNIGDATSLCSDPYRVVRRRSIIYLKHSASGTTYNDSISLAAASAIIGSMADVMALANNMATNAAIVETAKLIVNTALSYAVSTLTSPLLVSQINLTVASGIQAGINGSTQQIIQTLAGLGVQASDVEMLGKVFNISISLAVQTALADLLTTGSQYNPGIIRMILESFRIPTLTNESFKLPSIINETFLGPS